MVASPDITMFDLHDKDQGLVLASAGLWDVVDPPDVASMVIEELSARRGAQAAARRLVDEARSRQRRAQSRLADTTALVVALR